MVSAAKAAEWAERDACIAEMHAIQIEGRLFALLKEGTTDAAAIAEARERVASAHRHVERLQGLARLAMKRASL